MLRIIQGGAKSGKSTRIREMLLELSRSSQTEGQLLLFVPEQFSFETERSYAEALGMAQADKVRVTSFARFSGDIFREFGGLAGEYASDTVKLITMTLAMQECKSELGAYGRLTGHADFPQQLVQMVEELKNAGVSGDDLENASLQLGDGVLKNKLNDLSLIRAVYEGKLTEHYLDALDDPGRAARLCGEHNWFASKKIFLDGFKSFTAVQERLIGMMLSQKAEVTVSLPIGGDETDIRFAVPRETSRRLRSLAYQAGEAVPVPEILPDNPGFQSDALRHFSREILRTNPKAFSGENDAVECAGLFHEFDEAQFAAARILEYVRTGGYSFENIAVLVRNMDKYGPLLEAAFERYEIPFYMDRVESVNILPLFRFVSHLMEAAADHLAREQLLALLKCGMLPISLEEIAAFENYTYVWNIDRSEFLEPFTRHPAGYTSRPVSETEQAELEAAENVRSLLVRWIGTFQQEQEQSGSWPRALYAVLDRMELPGRIGTDILRLRQENRQKDSDDLRRSWEVLMELLSAMDNILGSRPVKLREFSALFEVSAACYDLGRIPQTLDSVLIGSAERVRIQDKKVVLILGANDREFPLLPSSGGMFTEKEREMLSSAGVDLTGRTEEAILEEKFVAWQALSSPSCQLTITYALGDLKGGQCYPSAIPAGFQAIFPHTPVKMPLDFPPEFFCRSPRTTFLQTIRRGQDGSEFTASALAYLNQLPEYSARLKVLERMRSGNRLTLSDSALSSQMFGGDKSLSPSQIERFYNCRFQYFCQYGLHIRSRTRAELNPMSRGTIIHYLLEQVLSGGDFLTMSEEELRKLIEDLLAKYLNEVMGGEEQSRRFLYLYHRMAENAMRVLLALQAEFSQTEFTVAGLEEPIYPSGRITPLHIKVPDQDGSEHRVTIVGKVDRIDRWQKDGKGYVRIIDYKTGNKQFSLDEVAEGLNLQMLLYLFSIWRGGKGALSHLSPAGILYLPAGILEPGLPRNAGKEMQQEAITEGFTMNGLLLNDHTVLCAMESGLHGKFLPVSMGKTKMKGEKWLADLQDFENLEWYACHLVQAMEGCLLKGEISPNPIQCGQFPPCRFCEFMPVCGWEPADGFRTPQPASLDTIASVRRESEKEELI